MTSDRWDRINDLLDEVLTRPPGERAAYLDAQAPDDAALRQRVLDLAASYEAAQSFLEDSLGAYAAPLVEGDGGDGASDPLIGHRVGAYRLLRRLGRGGMGTVYLAARDDEEYEKTVAVKLIRRGLDTDDVLRRFLHERQILARLEHPGIARLLDGGATEDGRPYFVMEYVDGAPLDSTFCDARRLTTDARLRLFLDVCDAVQYAHQNLVVHRDLKPSNILVTPADGSSRQQAQVKLLDFGIAAVLAEDEAEARTLTRAGLRVMTPEYAAPEQIRGEAATTATDVYALGVLLYQLLTSRPPYQLRDRSSREVERVILDTPPTRPSAIVTRSPTADTDAPPEAISRHRQTSPAALRRTLRGDLDSIVLKALKKEPEQRYPSVRAFADDIRRYLDGHPVQARHDAHWYRLGKFVRRHRVGVTAAAVVAVLLVSYALTTRAQAEQIARERDKAEEVTAFVLSLFEAADPFETPTDSLSVDQLVERGVAQVDRSLRHQPVVQGQMLMTLSQVYQNLGRYDEAQPLAERALAVRRAALGDAHPDVAASLDDLADVACYRGRYAASDSLYEAAHALRVRLLGDDHLDVANTLHDWGLLRYYMDQQETAEAFLREAVAIRRQQLGDRHPDVAEGLHSLGATVAASGDLEAAEPLLREALAIRRETLGEHPDLPANMTLLARLLQLQDRLDEAEALIREALAMQQRLLDADHPYVGATLLSLGVLLRDKGDLPEAASSLREALTITERRLGAQHPRTLHIQHELAQVLRDRGQHDAAERLFRSTLAMRRQVQGPAHPDVTSATLALADLLDARGDSTAAERLLRDAFGTFQRERGTDDEHTQRLARRLDAR
ncbi:MAG: tetratricopeptide repeat protein [Bacteroidetes bacterium]|jgi:serine/threonine-protein kinase|nr:tetratricopeptide repeat protein [Bacteroidota bacterium]